MEHSIKIGISFGLTSGIITTLGLMVGLYTSTGSRLAVVGGILVIAIADALSDAFGVHVAEESENVHTEKEIWAATISTFLCKFLVASTFVIPVLLFSLAVSVLVSIVWGVLLLSILSLYIGYEQENETWKIVLEHLTIATVVLIITFYTGKGVEVLFG